MPDLSLPPLDTPIAWALTYLIHSSALLGLCWAVARLARPRQREEGLWKLALVAGLLTVSLQGFLGIEPVAGRLQLGAPATPTPAALQPAPATPEPRSLLEVATPAGLLALAWLLAALVLGARLILASIRLSATLRDRRVLHDGPAREQLDELRRAAGLDRPVALAVSDRIGVPIARGLLRPEICLSPRALSELQPDELRTVLAHELAHVARRDALWQLGARLLEIAIPFQPLHRLARRRLAHLFELASDDWAARLTGEPLALARSLAKVAEWTVGPRRQALDGAATVSALAARPSNLGARVRRLVSATRAHGPGARRGSAAPLLAFAAAVALTPFTAPAFTASGIPPAPQPPPIAPEPTVLPVPATAPPTPALAPATPAPMVAGQPTLPAPTLAPAAPALAPPAPAALPEAPPGSPAPLPALAPVAGDRLDLDLLLERVELLHHRLDELQRRTRVRE
jgi:Zn-dependent protease with chaperone function